MDLSEHLWPDPWEWVGGSEQADYRKAWETQLAIELASEHILLGQGATLVGRRFDTDDALFFLADGQWAQVHLTWRPGPNAEAKWPVTSLFPSFAAWLNSFQSGGVD